MTLSLNYGNISNASKNAKKIGNEIGQYIDNLNKKVQNKIDSVTGGSSTALSNASYFIDAKISQLDKRRDNAYTLSARIANLKETAERVDKNVARTISANRKSLYENYSCLKPNALKRAWNSLLCCLKNVPIIGNIIKFIKDIGDALSELKNKIRDWWKYEGGKIIGDIILKIGLAVAAVCTAIAAILSGGVIFIVAACVAAVIAVANAVTNTCEELNARRALKNGKYGQAAVHSGRDSTAQWLRETNFHDAKLNGWSNTGACILDIADTVAGIVLIVHDLGEIADKFLKKNGVSFAFKERVMGKDGKWTTKVTGKSFRRGVKAMITNQPLTESTKHGLRTTLFTNVKDGFKYKATLFKMALRDPKNYYKRTHTDNLRYQAALAKMALRDPKSYLKADAIHYDDLKYQAKLLGMAMKHPVNYFSKAPAETWKKLGSGISGLAGKYNSIMNSVSGSSVSLTDRIEQKVQSVVQDKVFGGTFSDVMNKTGAGKFISGKDPSGTIGKYTGWTGDGVLQKISSVVNPDRGIYYVDKKPYVCYAYSAD